MYPDEHALEAFHVMAKPTGARCNLDCAYCFFLKKDRLYPGSSFRMSDEVLEAYIKQTIEGHRVPEVTIAWQGGEPTLMGLGFFRKAVELEKKYARPGMRIENTFQTNGVLLDDGWGEFLHENGFLVGLSLDGPRELHDAYRRDKRGGSVFDKVVQAARLLQKHDVEFNVLCTVNAVNSLRPLEVYRFFRDDLGARYLQFIPIVERDNESGDQTGSAVTDRSVDGRQYGRFLIGIFDEWVRRDVGRMFVLFFDGVLAAHLSGRSTLCVLRPKGACARLRHLHGHHLGHRRSHRRGLAAQLGHRDGLAHRALVRGPGHPRHHPCLPDQECGQEDSRGLVAATLAAERLYGHSGVPGPGI